MSSHDKQTKPATKHIKLVTLKGKKYVTFPCYKQNRIIKVLWEKV